jgi:hypothetical protein
VLGEGIRGLGAASSVSGVISNVLVIPRNEESPGVAGMSRDRTRFARGSSRGQSRQRLSGAVTLLALRMTLPSK